PSTTFSSLSPRFMQMDKRPRNCLICDASITVMNLGIDACRACAVFYRRARRSKRKFRCKGSSCIQDGRVSDCRSCRYDRMKAVFEQANKEIKITPQSVKPRREPEPPMKAQSPQPPPSVVVPVIRCPSSCPSTSHSASTPVLDRLRRGYDMMVRIRKTAELSIRPDEPPIHPSAIDKNDYPNIECTHGMKIQTRRILLSSLFDFASIAFPDFSALADDEKWRLISGSCMRIDILESTHRAAILYPDDTTIFTSYTTVMNLDTFDVYLSDCPLKVNVEEAKKELMKNIAENSRKVKKQWQRTKPTDDEFLVMLALAFWNTGDDSLCRLATISRNEIMKDVHAFYTQKGLTDYAMRIGELYCLLAENERITTIITEDYTLLGLMNNEDEPIT
ncbi:hypothetical protein PMAYCL1PPCAC_22041, partial [Pristionchus mayeri]